MTPLHCAAISHSATMKALSSGGLVDVSLQTKAVEKLSCVQMILSAGASLLSQVQHSSPHRCVTEHEKIVGARISSCLGQQSGTEASKSYMLNPDLSVIFTVHRGSAQVLSNRDDVIVRAISPHSLFCAFLV